MKNYRLGDMELEFANLIWENEPISSGGLVQLCEQKFSWKKSTTYTMLKRLCDKGIFQEEMAARTYFNYRPVRCSVDRYYNMDCAEITRQRLLCAFGCNRQYACYTFLCGTV